MAGGQPQLVDGGGPQDGCAVGGHRAQASPELGTRHIAAVREKIADHKLQRAAPARVERQVKPRQLRGAAHPDAVAQPGDGHLVALVHDGRFGRGASIGDRQGQREAFDRVDGQPQAQWLGHGGAVAAQRQQVAVGLHQTGIGLHAGDCASARAAALQAVHFHTKAELHAQPLGDLGQRLGELQAIARLVTRQAQRADKLVLHPGQRGLVLQIAAAAQQFKGHAVLLKDFNVLGRAVQLFLGAEQLQRALHALVVGDAGVSAQGDQAIAAVLGQPHHSRLVDAVARLGAVAQHLGAPTPHRPIQHRLDDQRAVLHQQPVDGLERHARARPRRRVAGRYLAGIGVAGFQRGRGLALQHGDLVAVAGQVIGRRGADHAAAEDHDLHGGVLMGGCSRRVAQ